MSHHQSASELQGTTPPAPESTLAFAAVTRATSVSGNLRCRPSVSCKFEFKRRALGFTLIELMIAVVIVGILTMVALPSYKQYVIRGKIPDATAALAQKRLQMEQFFQDNRTYVNAPACPASASADTTTSQYFKFYCASGYPTSTSYILDAEGVGSMAGFLYSVDQSNNKSTTIDTTLVSGWSAGACWVTNPGGC